MKTTRNPSVNRRAMSAQLFSMAAVLLAASPNSPAQSPTADPFNPGANGGVSSLAVQTDGKILAGGGLFTLGGLPRNRIGRLNADGSLDAAFNPGANGEVDSLAVQTDGKIVVAGSFTLLGGQPRSNIGRLNADGSLDTTFNPGANFPVSSLAVQADGKILAGGNFTTLGSQPRNYIGRLNANGSVDTTFNPGADNTIGCLALQADGKILAGGDFFTLGGQARANIGRINANGSVDTTFNPGANSDVVCLAVQADGKILVGGGFSMLGSQTCTNLGRLNAEGSLNITFNPRTKGSVYFLAGQADGKTLVGGHFTLLGGQARTNLGRLNNTEAATQSLTFDGAAITWLRGGPGPEVWRTTFEVCTNGTDWISLGAGTRIAGGWRLTGLNYPTNAAIRARGFVCGANWFVETSLVPPVPLRFACTNGSPSVSNGWFNARLMGAAGTNVVVECSSDLTNWTPWQTNTLPAGGWDLAMPLGADQQQFFRARLVP